MFESSPETENQRQSPEEHLAEPVSSLSVELQRISAEIQSINSGFQSQLHDAIAETHHAIERYYRAKFETSVFEVRQKLQKEITEKLQAEFDAELERRVTQFTVIRKEIERVSALLETTNAEIQALLNDPSSELAKVIRKRSEQVEMQSYLHGLRFAAGENL